VPTYLPDGKEIDQQATRRVTNWREIDFDANTIAHPHLYTEPELTAAYN